MTDESIMEDLHFLDENVKSINAAWMIEEPTLKKSSIFKRLIRKLTYWLYKPSIDQQTEFNKYIAAAVGDIYRMQSKLIEGIDGDFVMTGGIRELEHNGKPRIFQLVSSLNFGDAVGNEVIAFKKALIEAGYSTEIYAETIHKKIEPRAAVNFKYMPEPDENDIVIYHFSSQCGMFERVKLLKCKIILRYHNITPPEFFHSYDSQAEKATSIGLKQAAELKDYVNYCLPVSEFNKNDLIAMGYTCPMTVIPILIQFSDYEQAPSQKVIEQYGDGRTNVLFVGRMAPNKKVEDVITCFAEYKKTYDSTARLFLVGSFNEDDKYYRMLCEHIKKIGVTDVIFPGHIPFNEILAYYSMANVFLCLSEHEGFCVPLVEAMYFHIPVIAYDSSAVSSTLGGSGVLVDNKSPANVAAQLNKTVSDKSFAQQLVDAQNARLLDFDNELITQKLLNFVGSCLDSDN